MITTTRPTTTKTAAKTTATITTTTFLGCDSIELNLVSFTFDLKALLSCWYEKKLYKNFDLYKDFNMIRIFACYLDFYIRRVLQNQAQNFRICAKVHAKLIFVENMSKCFSKLLILCFLKFIFLFKLFVFLICYQHSVSLFKFSFTAKLQAKSWE